MPQTPDADEYLPLLKTQKNEALQWIVQAGLEPSAFEVGAGECGGALCTRFAYKGSPFFFDVGTARHSYQARYYPGKSDLVDLQMAAGTFARLEADFKAWLANLRREVEAPDLWAIVQTEGGFYFGAGTADNNEPFADVELMQIVGAMDEVRAFIASAGLAPETTVEANLKVDYLVSAAPRVGRFDWINLAFTTLWSIVVAAAFNPGQARAIFEIVANAIRPLISG